ncbi:hypothetical protein ABZV58_23695 [Nocardia sp. NPDC004654]|uniref:hypothetical protein n=1 Tax=Nocardia sp. NPDC004654 TaxID=3154776 RepID=UPI0033A23C40
MRATIVLKQTLKALRAEQDSLRGAQALAVLADIGSTPGELRQAVGYEGFALAARGRCAAGREGHRQT